MGMIHRIRQSKNIYGRFFLATEAPGDADEEVTEETKQKRNVKVITVKPDNRRRKGFEDTGEDVADDEDENTEEFADTQDDVTDNEDQEEPAQEETAEETTEENDEGGTDEFADNQDDVEDENDNETDTNQTNGDQNQENTTEEETEEADTGADPVDGEGNDDFADTGNDVGGGDTTTDTTTSTDQTGIQPPDPNQTPGIDYDTTRKYNLYKEYMSLYNACENYISKLENVLKDDAVQNQIIRIVVSNLREIKDCIYDYLTIRFQLDSYVQALIFYQKIVVSVQLSFNLLCTKNEKPKNSK